MVRRAGDEVQVILKDDVAKELKLLVLLEVPPRVKDDLHGLGAGENGQPTTVQVMK
jgi:hypothetical protein